MARPDDEQKVAEESLQIVTDHHSVTIPLLPGAFIDNSGPQYRDGQQAPLDVESTDVEE